VTKYVLDMIFLLYQASGYNNYILLVIYYDYWEGSTADTPREIKEIITIYAIAIIF